jgi:hypothetical protein
LQIVLIYLYHLYPIWLSKFEVAKVNEIPLGKMKYVELNGKEIMIANNRWQVLCVK